MEGEESETNRLNVSLQEAISVAKVRGPTAYQQKSYDKVPASTLKSVTRDRKAHRTMMKLEKKHNRLNKSEDSISESSRSHTLIFDDSDPMGSTTGSIGNESGSVGTGPPLPQIHVPEAGSVRSGTSRRAYGLTPEMQDAVSLGSRGKHASNMASRLPPGLQFGSPKDLNHYLQRATAFQGNDQGNSSGATHGDLLLATKGSNHTPKYQTRTGRDFSKFNRNDSRRRLFFWGGIMTVSFLIVALGLTIPSRSARSNGNRFGESSYGDNIRTDNTLQRQQQRTVPSRPTPVPPPDFLHSSSLRTNHVWDSDALKKMLEAFTQSNFLEDTTTTEGKAFAWLQTHNLSGLSTARVQQRYALVSIYFSWQARKWKNSHGWLTSAHECTWYGVKCGSDRSTSDTNNLSDVVTYINLRENNIQGMLPRDLTLLPALTQVHLSENFLMGEIPKQLIQGLPNVHTLYLDGNFLNGTIPDAIGTMKNLKYLDLSFNSLDGLIPHTLGSCQSLVDLRLNSNELDGQLPPLFSSTPKLQVFLAGNNELEGPIPTNIGLLPVLRSVQLHENAFSGKIPDFVSTELEMAHFDSNAFTGSVPIFESGVPLKEIRMERNQLDGTLPIRLGDHVQLSLLNLAHNNLTGPVPSQLGQLERLSVLHIEGNELSGPVPEAVCSLKTGHNLESFVATCGTSNLDLTCGCCDSC